MSNSTIPSPGSSQTPPPNPPKSHTRSSIPPPQSNPRISFIISSRLPSLAVVTAQYIRLVLMHCNGNQSKAAKILGISRATIHRAMKE